MRRTRLLAFAQVAAAALALAQPRSAWAKQVSLQWKPITGAVGYEIWMQREGKTARRQQIDETAWHGQLDAGIYEFRIRAIDRIKRPGAWSGAVPLVVTPTEAPEPQSPADGLKMRLFSSKAAVHLEWKSVPGVDRYEVAVKEDGKVVRRGTYGGHDAELAGLPIGSYSWTVRAVVGGPGRVPAALAAKSPGVWQGPVSDESAFRIEHRNLEHPLVVFPVGTERPPSNGYLLFRWKPVEGAQKYRLKVWWPMARGRVPASKLWVREYVVAKNQAWVPTGTEGSYKWEVAALANVDAKGVAEAESPASRAEFDLNRNAEFFEGSGYVALSTMLAPYGYQVDSALHGSGSASSVAVTGRVSGEYYFSPQWGIAGAFELGTYTIAGHDYNRTSFELTGKYRINLTSGSRPWSLSPKVGLEGRGYFELIAAGGGLGGGFTDLPFYALGPSAGVDLRKQLSDKLSLGIKISYFLPVMLAGSPGGGVAGGASYRNLSVGAQALYWFGKHFGAAAGAYGEMRSIGFSTTAATPDQVYMDGLYFFGSVIYSFGR